MVSCRYGEEILLPWQGLCHLLQFSMQPMNSGSTFSILLMLGITILRLLQFFYEFFSDFIFLYSLVRLLFSVIIIIYVIYVNWLYIKVSTCSLVELLVVQIWNVILFPGMLHL